MSNARTRRRAHTPPCAFSLVELVIVIVIIGIIAAIAVPRFANATKNANLAQAKASQSVLQDAIDLYVIEQTPDENWEALDKLGPQGATELTDLGYIRSYPPNLLYGENHTAFTDDPGNCDQPTADGSYNGWIITQTGPTEVEISYCEP